MYESGFGVVRTLSLATGHSYSWSFTILIDSGPNNDCANRIIILYCLREWFQDKHAAAFASSKPCASAIKCN